MDWDYYGTMIPRYLFNGQRSPEELIPAMFATGYPIAGSYQSGVLLGA